MEQQVGHHIQRELGTSDEVRNPQRESPDQADPLSVRLEEATLDLGKLRSPYWRLTVTDADGRRAWTNPVWA